MKKRYSEILSDYISNSGLSYGEIVLRITNKGINIHKSYISKLKNGTKPPASDEVNRALAEVTGGDPEKLILAAYLEKAPEQVKNLIALGKKEHDELHSIELKVLDEQLHAFSYRLKTGLTKSNLSLDTVSQTCGVTTEYLNRLINEPTKLPGISTLYKLAEIIGVTPDYLAGYTDLPQGFDSRTPRPKDMSEFLAKEEVMFEGKILTEDDKEKINNVLAAIFMDAKQKNRRS